MKAITKRGKLIDVHRQTLEKKTAAASAVAYSQLRLRGDGADEEHENISFY